MLMIEKLRELELISKESSTILLIYFITNYLKICRF